MQRTVHVKISVSLKQFIIFLLTIYTGINAYGQTGPIKGKVVNESGTPLPSVTVTIKGATAGTTTNDHGEFTIAVANRNTSLIISSIGYEKREVELNGKNYLTITLKQKSSELDQAVIIAYGTTTRRLNTGDVSTVTAADFQNQPVGDPLLAMEGRVPGLFIQQTSGIPGAEMNTIQLRGQHSIANGNSPLFIVDGVPFNSTTLTNPAIGGGAAFLSPFNTLNPSDIESIDVLKDADATAIYGSRGANGVVLITTKKGEAGKTKVDLNVYSGVGNVTRKIPLLNTKEYLEMRHEAFSNDGASPGPSDYDINGAWDTTRNTDWQKVLIGGTSHVTNAQGSISGGNNNTQFLISGGYRKETTVFPGNFSDQKGSVHFNLSNVSTNQKFKTTFSAGYVNDNSSLPSTDLTSNISLAPDAPALYDTNGNLNWQNSTWSNPLAVLLQKARAVTDNLIGNLSLSYEILPGLQIKSSFGYNKIEMNQSITYPLGSYKPVYSRLIFLRKNRFANNTIKTWIIEPQVSYHKRLGNNHFEVLLGATLQQNQQNILSQSAANFSNDALIENVAAASSIIIVENNSTQYRYNAIFSRINYNWKEKYLINLTARKDGSSRFGADKQFGNFGAIGGAWIFSEEGFIKKDFPFLSFGKLRASYGTTGNDQISDYQYLSTYSSYSYTYQGVTGLYPTQLTNPLYGWELVKKLEMAMEFGFLKDHILFDASYYRNRTGNQLVGYSLPAITGFSTVQANLPAIVQNTGVEFELNTTNIQRKNFVWTSSANLTIPNNKLVSYPHLAASSYVNTYEVGKSLFIQKLYHYTGVNPQTGIYSFQDVDKDGTISYPNDLEAIKQIAQNFYGGLQNSLTYGNWSLDVFIQFVKQSAYNYIYNFIAPGILNNLVTSNQPLIVLERWEKSGPVTNIEKFTQSFSSDAFSAYSNLRMSDAVISDASFIRIKNIALYYSLPAKYEQKMHLQNAKIYLQCQNLFNITNYLGLDPETGGSVPPLRMIIAGLQITI